MSISLCMIAKDEEEFIGKSLDSVYGFVDEIIVIDTGSKDSTIFIAEKYKAIIKESIWRKDFAFHRNESIDLAKSDWILFLDCDEVLEKENQSLIKGLLDNSNNIQKGYNVNITNVIGNKKIASFQALRLFKNGEGFKFVNPIHEQIIISIVDKYGEGSIGELPLSILHYGYEEEIQKKKNKRKRNIEILNTINNKDSYFYAMLGDEYLQNNDFNEAVRNYNLSFKKITKLNSGHGIGLIVNYITALINLRDYNSALSIIKYSKDKVPELLDIYIF